MDHAFSSYCRFSIVALPLSPFCSTLIFSAVRSENQMPQYQVLIDTLWQDILPSKCVSGGVFGQPFGQLDSAAQVLHVHLAPELGTIQPLNLTKEEIESFADAQGQALHIHYRALPLQLAYARFALHVF
jgi:hypothetical protein